MENKTIKIDGKYICVSFENESQLKKDLEEIVKDTKAVDVLCLINIPKEIEINIKKYSKNLFFFEEKIEGDKKNLVYIKHPVVIDNLNIIYIYDEESEYMQMSKETRLEVIEKMKEKSLPIKTITATVYEKDLEYISSGTNGNYHLEYGCKRLEMGCKSGEGWDLCEGCHGINHAEQVARKNAKEAGKEDMLKGANAYLHGYHYSCESCIEVLKEIQIKNLYISKDSTIEYFNIKEI